MQTSWNLIYGYFDCYVVVDWVFSWCAIGWFEFNLMGHGDAMLSMITYIHRFICPRELNFDVHNKNLMNSWLRYAYCQLEHFLPLNSWLRWVITLFHMKVKENINIFLSTVFSWEPEIVDIHMYRNLSWEVLQWSIISLCDTNMFQEIGQKICILDILLMSKTCFYCPRK